MAVVVGPFTSRRLGHSLGINHIPAKHCCYSCGYCRFGATPQTEVVRHAFHTPDNILREVSRRLASLRKRGETMDYLALAPDGEPTLDSRLGELIDGLRPLGVPIAVVSNAALIWREEVRAELARADWVCLKVDSVDRATWHALNRPHPGLDLATILEGIRAFAKEYRGTLASETTLVAGLNDAAEEVEALARFLEEIGIRLAYLSRPRPPRAGSVRHRPDESALVRAWHVLTRRLARVVLLTTEEAEESSQSTDARGQLLVAATQPMRASAVRALLARAGADMALARALVVEGRLRRVAYDGEVYYIRRLDI